MRWVAWFVALVLLCGCGGEAFSSAEQASDSGTMAAFDGALPPMPDASSAADSATAHDASSRPEAAPDVEAEGGPPADAGRVDATDQPDEGIDAGVCTTDLSNIGAGDFRISFVLTTSSTGETLGLVGQRTGCDMSTAFWDISLSAAGGIMAATDDGITGSFVSLEAGNSVNDGSPHQIVVGRTSGALWYSSDGVVHSAMVPDANVFGALPPLMLGNSACAGTTPLAGHGTMENLCITVL